MNYTPESKPSSNLSLAHFFSYIVAGFLAGIAAALLDIAQATSSFRHFIEVALMALEALGKLGFVGSLLGLIVAAAATLARILSKKLGKSESLLFALFLTGTTSPGLIYVSLRLFAGGTMSKLPAASFLKFIAALLLIVAFWAALRIGHALVVLKDSVPQNRKRGVFLVLSVVSFALIARFVDAHYYRRLYIYLHCVLGIVTLGSLGLAIRIALGHKILFVTNKMRATFFSVIVIILFAVAVSASGTRQTVRAACYENTATLADFLYLSSLTSNPSAKHNKQSTKTREARAQRSEQMRLASSDNWPMVAGAHILLITVDALRADKLGVYGHKTRDLTPNIDRWARDNAVVFERAYAAAPHSSYSISSLLTSRFTFDEAMFEKDIKHATIAEILKDNGYTTMARYTQGIFFTEGDAVGHYRRSKFGFEKVVHGGLRPAVLTDKAIEDIDQIVKNGEDPSMIWIHYFNVHEPYESTRFGTSSEDQYDGEIFETDAEVLRLIRYAEDAFDRDVIVFLTADHGEEFKDHGGYYHGSSLYDEQIRVPFIASIPGAQPHRIEAPVSTAAFVPTALKLVAIEPPPHMMGQDLRPAIFGGEQKHVAEPVVAAVMHQHMVVSWPWKLIVDPSKGIFELYNLKKDPLEKANRYDKKRRVADDLQDELNAWLDDISKGEGEVETALKLGHMRDPRAIVTLIDVARNTGAPALQRIESINLLGKMKVKSAKSILKDLLDDSEYDVSVAAALTLGELGDPCGTDIIYDALLDNDPAISDRAGLVLGKLGDTAAVPALVEALGRNDVGIREQAIRVLGNLRDKGAVEPLLDALVEERLRYLVVLALGKIGDPRAYEPLIDVLDRDHYTDVKGYAVVALGWLGQGKAVPRLIKALRNEPELKWTSEALVRLGGVGKSPLFGTDVAKDLPALRWGFETCTEKSIILNGEFQNRTTCKTTGNGAGLEFFVDAPKGATLIIRARHLGKDNGQIIPLKILVDNVEVGKVILSGQFQETRIPTLTGTWPSGNHTVTCRLESEEAIFELDHLIVLAN